MKILEGNKQFISRNAKLYSISCPTNHCDMYKLIYSSHRLHAREIILHMRKLKLIYSVISQRLYNGKQES